MLAFEVNISASSAYRILKKAGFNNVKPTYKPGLSDKAKQKRLAFCLKYEHWMEEDWKNVIFSDETSVVLGQQRGKLRLWRRTGEANDKTVVQRCYKNAKEFMFWGCFSWDKKGPCHIWKSETAAEKKAAQKEIDKINKEEEPKCKQEWELEACMRRLNLH